MVRQVGWVKSRFDGLRCGRQGEFGLGVVSRVVVRQARYVSFWCVMAGELGYVSSRFVWL